MLRPRVCAIVLVSSAVLSGCAGSGPTMVPVQAYADPEPLRVLVAGDSISEGYFASSAQAGFAEQLLGSMRRDGAVAPLLATESGARAWRIVREVDDVLAFEEPVDVAVLEVGTNDIGVSSQAEWVEDYTNLLAAVEAGSPDAVVACLGPWATPGASAPFERAVRRLCDTPDHHFVALSDLYVRPGLRGPSGTSTYLGERDDVHPNDLGHAAIARRVADTLALAEPPHSGPSTTIGG